MAPVMTLRRRLAHWVTWPLLAVLAASAVYDYYQALQRTQEDQDRALARIAIALATRLDVDADDGQQDDFGFHLNRTIAAMQRAEPQDRLDFLVRRRDGSLLGGTAALADWMAPSDEDDRSAFADRHRDGEVWRVASYAHRSPLGPLQILVAETTHRRESQARRLMLDTLVPNVLLVLLALGGVLAGVRLALRPLDLVSRQIAARDPDDLGPVPVQGLPGELAPFGGTINQLLDRVRESAAHQQTFLSNAAHQLRTPLAGIQTQLELAEREAAPTLRDRLVQVRAGIQRLSRSTHQMLALARSGPQAIQQEGLEPVDLVRLLETAADDWLDAALAAGVDLQFSPEAVRVMGSLWLLRELLANLIHNALQHTPAGGTVRVSCGPAGEGACLVVSDTGPGIPAADRAKVLERFYQRPGRLGGSGLGLSIADEVARRHHAHLHLDDTGDGPGTGLSVTVRFDRRL